MLIARARQRSDVFGQVKNATPRPRAGSSACSAASIRCSSSASFSRLRSSVIGPSVAATRFLKTMCQTLPTRGRESIADRN